MTRMITADTCHLYTYISTMYTYMSTMYTYISTMYT